ncbi:putative E3 ubiquitin-protein ligase RING1b [Abrus precatorius]|uniref:E3 ubiquitin-protein ligase RING1b n=1 Tax=Abrus precatorius TaxID=3816 RepID=A0A8B8L941_ABRPR|nr:putative E3 ubiquitin-protein ligase RING1b [Abrus precatorius]
MQKAYGMTLSRQTAAQGTKRPAAAAAASSTRGSSDKCLRRSNLKRKRNLKNASEIPGPSWNEGMSSSPNAEEIEIPESDTNEAERSDEVNVPQTEHGPIGDIISSSTTLVWGKNAQRSNTRNAKNVAAARANRLSKLIDHLQSSEQNDDELNIFIKLVSFEERRVPNLPRPYLRCKPTLSIGQLCQYVACETSLQTEEIELYLVKEHHANVIIGDGKLDPNKVESQFLTRDEETLAEHKIDNLSCGHLVIGYKRKMWNLNMMLP